MFGLFKWRPTEQEALIIAEKLANTASVEAVLEAGRYVGFLIHIEMAGSKLAAYFTHDAARSMFVELVEVLIQNGEFNPRPVNRAALGLTPVEDDGRDAAVRELVGPANAPLMQWNRPFSQEGARV